MTVLYVVNNFHWQTGNFITRHLKPVVKSNILRTTPSDRSLTYIVNLAVQGATVGCSKAIPPTPAAYTEPLRESCAPEISPQSSWYYWAWQSHGAFSLWPLSSFSNPGDEWVPWVPLSFGKREVQSIEMHESLFPSQTSLGRAGIKSAVYAASWLVWHSEIPCEYPNLSQTLLISEAGFWCFSSLEIRVFLFRNY